MTELIDSENTQLIKKPPLWLVILSAWSLIPFLGVPFALVSIIISLFNLSRSKIPLILGCSGIALTVLIWAAFLYYAEVQRGGTFDHMRVTVAQVQLAFTQSDLLDYKQEHGKYPLHLADLLPNDSTLNLKDPIAPFAKRYQGDSLYCYTAIKDTFVLFSVGFDGVPYTNDDIFPKADQTVLRMRSAFRTAR